MQSYLWFIAASVRASLSEFVLSEGAADEDAVPGPTSGKCCLNEAYSSSAGFCDFLLSETEGSARAECSKLKARVDDLHTHRLRNIGEGGCQETIIGDT